MHTKPILYKIISLITKVKNPFVVNEHFEPINGLELTPYLKEKNKTALHHLIRYYWAVEVLRQSEKIIHVLDLGCGSGYGSFILANSLPNAWVKGIDYDSKAIKNAEEKYKLDNLSYNQGDILKIKQVNKFDYIIFFDTLEHLSHREIALEKIINMLKPDGELFISTPCGHEEDIFYPPWPAHQIEYSYKSLYKFLRRYFKVVIGAEQPGFEKLYIFDLLNESGINYDHRMNPVICKNPISIKI